MAYAINLISALAKREYYARRDLSPREAFGATLRKVNEVVDEFFKNKGLELNVGIFAIAGEQMLISKLGKFKVLLAREDRTIDVLNNIDLFNKELTQEKQFSNIISGKVTDQDRILAFYPSKAVTARERYLKSYFLKLSQADFVAKLEGIKAQKEAFGCAALYVTFETVTEQQREPVAAPRELAPAATLASEPAPVPVRQRKLRPTEPVPLPERPQPAPQPVPAAAPQPVVAEVPRIIPSEFSLGKKVNPVAKFIHRLHLPPLSKRNRAILAGIGIVVVTGIVLGARAIFFQSAEERAAAAAVTDARTALAEAQAKASQNDPIAARDILSQSLAAISTYTEQDAQSVRNDLERTLDTLDHAEDVAAHVAVQFPIENGAVKLVALAGEEPNVVTVANDGQAAVLAVDGTSIARTVSVGTLGSVSLLSGKDSVSLLDPANATLVTVRGNKTVTAALDLDGTLVTGALYEDNLYAVVGTTIEKVADATTGDTNATEWLKSGSVSDGATGVAVDGNIYVLSNGGTVTTYYRGESTGSVQLPLSTDGVRFLTAGDNPNLYLVNLVMGRVYLVDKKLGTIVRTLKLPSQNIVDATVDEGGTIYYLTSDNKLWKTE